MQPVAERYPSVHAPESSSDHETSHSEAVAGGEFVENSSAEGFGHTVHENQAVSRTPALASTLQPRSPTPRRLEVCQCDAMV